MLVYVIPDLALLVCPPDSTPYDQGFLEGYWQIFLLHDEKVEAYGFQWILSDTLIMHLMNSFPWTHLDDVPWLRGFYEQFFLFWSRWTPPDIDIQSYPEAQISPDIIPDYIEAGTREAWHDVLVTCAIENSTYSQVASHPQQAASDVHVVPGVGVQTEVLKIICTIQQWEDILAQIDPWVAAHLPHHGDYPYIPPESWQYGQPFPKAASPRGTGFLDERRAIWVWDRSEQHWDVQHYPYGRDQYDRVTADGRRLD